MTHSEICAELSSSYRELAMLETQELHVRRRAWEESHETSATAREQYVRYLTTDISGEIIKLKGEIRAFEYELRACEWAVNHAN